MAHNLLSAVLVSTLSLLVACGGGRQSPTLNNNGSSGSKGFPGFPGTQTDSKSDAGTSGGPRPDTGSQGEPISIEDAQFASLGAADALLSQHRTHVEDAVRAISFASGLSGTKVVVMNGTLRETTAGQYQYTASPADRLTVVPLQGASIEMKITRYELNESGTVQIEDFLDAKHVLSFSLTSSDGSTLDVFSMRTADGSQRTLSGTRDNGRARLDVSDKEESTGTVTSTLSEHWRTSTTTASIAVGDQESRYSQTRNFHFSSGFGTQLYSDEREIKSSLTVGSIRYEMPDGSYTEYRKNGVLWALLFTGDLLKNGTKIGGLVQESESTSGNGKVVNTYFEFAGAKERVRSDVVFPTP